MDITPDNDLITYLARGEITGERPDFTTAFGGKGTYVAMRYECRFTYSAGQWSARAITVVGAVRNADGAPGRRTRSVNFIIGAEDTPDWVPPLVDRIRAAITL
ncbi:hypothetical protein ACPCSE_29295 [Streptomyces cellulosae]